MIGTLFAMIATSLILSSNAGSAMAAAENPFFERSSLPYQLPAEA